MQTALATKMMTYTEAKECVTKINANMTNIRSLVLDLYERKGWDALGYESWRECVVKEFGQNERYLYKQLEAAQVEKVVCPIGQKSEIPESQLRPLVTLRDDPEKQREAWTRAVETAPEGKVTAAHAGRGDVGIWGPIVICASRAMVNTSPRACSVKGFSPLAHFFVPEEHRSFLSDLCAPYGPRQNSPFALCSRNRKTYLSRGCDVPQESLSTSKDHIREVESR